MEFETTLINSSIYPLARVISMLCSTTTRYSPVPRTGLFTADHRTQRIDSSKLSHATPLQPAKNYRSGEVSTRPQYRAQPAADGGTDASGKRGRGGSL